MSRFRFVIFILLISFTVAFKLSAQQLEVATVRDQFFTMDKTKEGALKLYASLEKYDLTKDPVLLAYRGAASAASAGSVSGVRKKLEYFNGEKVNWRRQSKSKPWMLKYVFSD